MKNVKNNKVMVYNYTNEKFESHLFNESRRIIEKVVIPRARELGETNRPEPELTNGNSYIGEISAEFQDLITKAKDANQPEIEHFVKNERDSIIKEKEAAFKIALENKEDEIRIKKNEIARFDQALIEKQSKWNRIRWILYIIMLADTVIASSVFEIMGMNLLGSFIIGIGIAIALLFFSEVAPNLIRKGKSRWQRIFIITLLSSIVISVFYSLASFRVIQLSDNIEVFKEGLNPTIFVIINYFIFLTVTLVSYFYKPTEQEQKLLNEIKNEQKKLAILESEKHTLVQQFDRDKSQNLRNKITSAQVLQYAQNCEIRILSQYRKAYQKFVSTNLTYRRDRLVPIFFNDGPPPIQTFYLNGDSQLNNF